VGLLDGYLARAKEEAHDGAIEAVRPGSPTQSLVVQFFSRSEAGSPRVAASSRRQSTPGAHLGGTEQLVEAGHEKLRS
jgi:hypothetical protein